ncbi:MAG: UvrD-helicase domain-containing protein, partial [Alphaproteobacteria bacterium]|nr:UvrD-helicase domain-containing protein [Alphaproteobacteria bacterium]
IEAGISPAWSLVSGAAQSVLLQKSFDSMIQNSFSGGVDMQNTMNAFNRILDIKSEHFLDELRDLLLSRYRSFFQIEDIYKYREYFIETTQKILNIKNNFDANQRPDYLLKIIDFAKDLQKTSKKPAQYIQNIIDLTEQYIDKSINFDKYKSAYLTNDNTIIKNVLKNDFFAQEATRVHNVQQNVLNKTIFQDTLALFDLAMDFANTYRKIKQEHNLLDFEDLVLYTQKLFSKPDVMGWVLSQLDVSLSHILVDEAQDTSPQQWNILRMLAGDFFTDGDMKNNRSLFVVGDTKQSIYGFQNADPRAFATSRSAIEEQIQNNYRTIREVALDQSFRSVKPILDTVDCFFGCPSIVENTGFHNNKHKCFRITAKGFVEIHDSFKCDKVGTEKNKLYVRMLADKIAELVRLGRKPSDIMVLVQKRGAFVDLLSNELKKRNIDIAGNDRIKLPEFSAVKDLLYLVRFCNDQTDDYSLCCVLKSPFYQLKEQDIFNLCKIKNSDKNQTVFGFLGAQNPDVYSDLLDTIEKS